MKRFAALFLAVWLLLLMGCAASRQLEQVCVVNGVLDRRVAMRENLLGF